jgi:membrane protease YdiL (CAAX protease family)
VLAGIVLGGSAAVLIALVAAVPAARDAFTDDRVLGVGVAGLAYHTLIRIPLGTALFEEVAFRGVLPALGRSVTAPRRADLGSAVLFGLWHVIPASSVAAGNEAASGFAAGAVVVGAVLGTAVAGIGFTWLRNRYGLAAPILLHAAINSAAFVAAWAVA